jgi:hypothetical protein
VSDFDPVLYHRISGLKDDIRRLQASVDSIPRWPREPTIWELVAVSHAKSEWRKRVKAILAQSKEPRP